MELALMIINYCLKAIDSVNVVEERTTLTIAKKLCEEMSEWDAKTALKILLKEESNAE